MNNYEDIIEKAKGAMRNAYTPYSKFNVGACVKTKDGKYFIGANIENASYGLTNCAERTALFQVYTQGYRKEDIESMAIVGEGPNLISPCGACRQVMAELIGRKIPVILSTRDEVKVTSIDELMPMSFTSEDL